jgi:hypothetical protein
MLKKEGKVKEKMAARGAGWTGKKTDRRHRGRS